MALSPRPAGSGGRRKYFGNTPLRRAEPHYAQFPGCLFSRLLTCLERCLRVCSAIEEDQAPEIARCVVKTQEIGAFKAGLSPVDAREAGCQLFCLLASSRPVGRSCYHRVVRHVLLTSCQMNRQVSLRTSTHG